MATDLESQLRDLRRDLQRKIDKARPIVEQHERGELRALSDEQQRMIDSYPNYIADMAEVKAGNLPKPRPKPAAPKPATPPPAADVAIVSHSDVDHEPEEDDSQVTAPAPATKNTNTTTKISNPKPVAPAAKGAAKTPAKAPVGAMSKHDRLVLSIANARGPERKALLDGYIATQLDKKRLVALEKEYDGVCQLRRDILMGKVAQPTKLQQSKVALADSIKKDLDAEQAALDSQASRIRLLLLAEASEHDATIEDEMDDVAVATAVPVAAAAAVTLHPVANEWEAPPAAAVDLPEAAPPVQAEEVKSHPAPSEETAPAAAIIATTPPAPAPVADEPAAEAAKPAAHEEQPAEEAPAAAAPMKKIAPNGNATKQGKGKGAAARDTEVAAPVADPAVPPPPPIAPAEPPPPPKEIDWSDVVITRNRKIIAAPALRSSSPAAADAKARPGRSASPAARDGTPTSAPAATTAAPVALTFPTLLFDATNSGTSEAGPAAAAPSKPKQTAAGGQGKGAKGAASAPAAPAAASATSSTFRQSAAARLARDWAACQAQSLPFVGAALIENDLFRWAVNVSVTEGPLVGCIVPLEIHFTDFFPAEPPTIKSIVDIPHPSIVPSNQTRFAVCLEHTALVNPKDISATRGWTPAYGAASILAQLQVLFSAENFAKLEKTQGPKIFGARMRAARLAIANYSNPVTGHRPDRAVPAVPFVNGPLRHAPEATLVRAGLIRCRAVGEGNVWRHSYGRSGSHTFRVTIRSGAATVGLTTDGDREDLSVLGSYPGSWCLNTQTGALSCEGESRDLSSETKFPLPANSSVDVTVRPADGEMMFAVNGAVIGTVSGITTTGPFAPAYCLLTVKTAVEVIMFTSGAPVPPVAATAAASASGDSSPTDPVSSPVTASASADVAGAPVVCAMSLASPSEALLCLGIEVSKRHRTFLPAEVHSTQAYIAYDQFNRVAGTRAPNGFRFDFPLPLLLHPKFNAQGIAALKKTIMSMSRNPQASTLYDPPFRPQLVCSIMTELLRGVVRDTVHAKTPDFATAFVNFTRLVHSFAALALEIPSIEQEAAATVTVAESSSTVIFCASTIVAGVPWPEVVRLALRAELAGREPESEAAAFALLQRALPKLLIGGAMANAVRCASLQRAVEIFSQHGGGPSPEMAAAVQRATQARDAVGTWEGLCDYLTVSTSLEEVLSP